MIHFVIVNASSRELLQHEGIHKHLLQKELRRLLQSKEVDQFSGVLCTRELGPYLLTLVHAEQVYLLEVIVEDSLTRSSKGAYPTLPKSFRLYYILDWKKTHVEQHEIRFRVLVYKRDNRVNVVHLL